MGATKKDFEKLIQEYNHQMMIANLPDALWTQHQLPRATTMEGV